MGTDNDVGKPAFRSEGWYAARAAELKAKLTGVLRQRYDRLVAATSVDVDTLSPRAQLALVWLAGWDEPTVVGVIELLDAARRVGEQSCIADVARLVGELDVVEADVLGDLLATGKLDDVPFGGDEDAFWCRCGHSESNHEDDGTGRCGRCMAPFGRPRSVLVGGCKCMRFELACRPSESGAA